jgi:Ca2+-transporting ATPase
MYLGVENGWIASDGVQHAQTMLFTTIVLAQLLHAFNFRSETRSVFRLETLENRWLVSAFVGSVALQSLVIYVPALQRLFKTQALGMHDWIAVLVASVLPLILIDAMKVLSARRRAR